MLTFAPLFIFLAMTPGLKSLIHEKCLSIVREKLTNAKSAVDDAQSSANEETKSTAGDKHDTSKAMAQLEVETAQKVLVEVEKTLELLKRIEYKSVKNVVESGALVTTADGRYYFSVGLGKIVVDDSPTFALSILSPLGNTLKGLKKGDTVEFNGKKIEILHVQ